MLKPELVLASAVVAAKQFNPSVISQIWLVNSGIAGANDFGPTCIFTPEFVQVGTKTFNLVCTPDQLQLAPVGDVTVWGSIVGDALGKVLRTLPHTPFSAIGLNFIWRMRLDEATAGRLTRRLFAAPSALSKHFDSPDARFGAYLSKNYEEMRLKLDIKPVEESDGESLQMAFNFHKRVASQPLEELLTVISKWDRAWTLSQEISTGISEGAAP